ncbi:MAG TPA: hypothetical protein VNZ57_04135 [Longimicrobiales bacterium]|nr:hypothetical protein [Longimicrobiales bacterium]
MPLASPGWRITAAVTWIVAANAIVVWWLTGDLELAWLLALIIVLVASVVIGMIGAVLLAARPPAALVPVLGSLVLSPTLGVLLFVAAIRVAPHLTRSLDPPPALRAAADSLAADRDALQAEARRITGVAVEIDHPNVVYTHGRVFKKGFRLGLTRIEPTATVSFTFTAGPGRRMIFDVIRDDDGWRLRPRDAERFAAHPGITFTRAYLEQRFPGLEATFDAGWPTYYRGDTVLAILQRAGTRDDSSVAKGPAPRQHRGAATARATAADTDSMEFVVFRIGEGEELLEEVRRYSSDEITRRFSRAAATAGLGRLRSLRFVRMPNRLQDPSFGFLGELEGGPRRTAWFAAIRKGEEVEFSVAAM